MKPYCTQNNGDCSTCSLVNYGRDCRNNPIRIQDARLQIRVPTDLKQEFEAWCANRGTTSSDEVRRYITKLVRSDRDDKKTI